MTKAYKIYTKMFDEIVRPLDLLSIEEMEDLAQLTTKMRKQAGFKDNNFYKSLTGPKGDVELIILMDNSGSMYGNLIIEAHYAAMTIAKAAQHLGFETEILGFTTVSWKGGEPYKQFSRANKAAYDEAVKANKTPEKENPGRLNAIRHIIFKTFEETTDEGIQNMALMVRQDLRKENIDGEALLWAKSRFSNKARLKKLLVITDGASIDDATLSYNGPDYLKDHLIHVLEDIVKTNIDVSAISIREDKSLYPNTAFVNNANELKKVCVDYVKNKLLK